MIDALVVELGLDPTKWHAGQREAESSIAKTREAAQKGATEWEALAKRGGESIQMLQTQALKLASIFLGGLGIERILTSFAQVDSAAGRTARYLEMPVEVLSQWENAARTVGAAEGEIRQSFQNLRSEMTRFQMGLPAPAIGALRSLLPGVNVLGMSPDAIFRMIAERRAGMEPARLAEFMSMIGAGRSGLDLVSLGGAGLNERLQQARAIGVLTAEQARHAAEMQKSWALMEGAARNIGRIMADWASPKLQKLFDDLTAFFSKWDVTGFLNRRENETVGDLTTNFGNMLMTPTVGDAWRWMFGGGGSRFGFTPTASSSWPSGGAGYDAHGVEAYIRKAATARGIDPQIALAVARSEGLYSYVGDRGSSFGPFQLHYGGIAGGGMATSGLGDVFTRQTGLDARDPSTVHQQIDFALDQAASGGWGPWHGWKGAQFAGIGKGGARGGAGSTVTIGNINVTSTAADLSGVATDTFQGAFRDAAVAAMANTGMQ